MTTTETAATWQKRVASWRASGETAAEFGRRHGFAATTLWYWASRLKREGAKAAPVVRLAQLVRIPGSEGAARRGAIVVDLIDVRARITIEPGVDRETLSTVVQALGGVAR